MLTLAFGDTRKSQSKTPHHFYLFILTYAVTVYSDSTIRVRVNEPTAIGRLQQKSARLASGLSHKLGLASRLWQLILRLTLQIWLALAFFSRHGTIVCGIALRQNSSWSSEGWHYLPDTPLTHC